MMDDHEQCVFCQTTSEDMFSFRGCHLVVDNIDMDGDVPLCHKFHPVALGFGTSKTLFSTSKKDMEL
jgi:hypothetical protein